MESAGWAPALAFAAFGCDAELVLPAFCVFAGALVCGLPGLVGVEALALEFGCGGLFWLCELCAGVVSLLVAVPDAELFLAWEVLLAAGAGGVGLAWTGLSCGALAASSKAENGWDVGSCCVAAAAARCCEDCINDDVELTSDAILGTARSLKA